MQMDSVAKNTEPTSSPSQGVIDAAETAAHAAEAKDNPPKDDARDPIDVAVEGAKSERIPVRELVSILPLKAHDDTTASARPEVILAEAKKGYDLLFLGLGSGSKATTHNFPPAIEKIVREFTGPVAILLNCAVRDVSPDAALEKILVPTSAADYSRFGAEVAVAIAKGCGAMITAIEYLHPGIGK
jgi:hypothetical protein